MQAEDQNVGNSCHMVSKTANASVVFFASGLTSDLSLALKCGGCISWGEWPDELKRHAETADRGELAKIAEEILQKKKKI